MKQFIMFLKRLLGLSGGQNKEKNAMKTLVELAKLYLAKNGADVGFTILSMKTKKTFMVLSKTTSGKFFVIQLIADKNGKKIVNGEEYQVSGTEARYTFVGASTRVAELESAIEKLENQRDNLESEISDLHDQLSELEDESA